jgi:uncharacterized protein (UPF0276 family)
VLLERDEDFPAAGELAAELAAVRGVFERTARDGGGARV